MELHIAPPLPHKGGHRGEAEGNTHLVEVVVSALILLFEDNTNRYGIFKTRPPPQDERHTGVEQHFHGET